jgi:hypothetical protein
MNAKKATAAAVATGLNTEQNQIAQAYANSYWQFFTSAPRSNMSTRPPDWMQEELMAHMDRNGHEQQAGAYIIVEFFGPHQGSYRNNVVSPTQRINTLKYDKGREKSKGSSTYLIHESEAEEFQDEMNKLVEDTRKAVAEFVADYDRLIAVGRAACEENFPHRISGDKFDGTLADWIYGCPGHKGRVPSKKEFKERLLGDGTTENPGIYWSGLFPLPYLDATRAANMPASFVDEAMRRINEANFKEAEANRSKTIDLVLDYMKLWEGRQRFPAEEGEKMRPSAERAVRLLKELATVYPKQQKSMLNLAEKVQRDILDRAKDWGTFTEDKEAREATDKAAVSVVKQLTRLTGNTSKASKPKAAPVKAKAKPPAKVKAGGRGLIARRKARQQAQASA